MADPLIEALEALNVQMTRDHDRQMGKLQELDAALFRADADVMRKIEAIATNLGQRRADIVDALTNLVHQVNSSPRPNPLPPPLPQRGRGAHEVLQ